MPKLTTGYIQNEPDFRYAGAKNTPILKFRIQVGDSWFKRQDVVVFGNLAEKNQDVARGEFVTLSGELQENTFRDETKMELVIGWKGNFKRHPEKAKKEMLCPTGGEDDDEDYAPADGLAAAPRSYRGVDFKSKLSFEPVDDCPDIFFPDPTDEDYAEAGPFCTCDYAESLKQGSVDATDNQFD